MANFAVLQVITGTRIIWINKGDSGVGHPIKHEKLNTCFFMLPCELLLNERKRKGGRGGKGGREKEKEDAQGQRELESRQQWPKATTNSWRTESRWNGSREPKTRS